MSDGRPIIAVLDDELNMRIALRRLLQLRGYGVALFESGAALIESYTAAHFACILLDLHMPGMNGFTLLETLSGRHAPPIVVITANDQPDTAERVLRLGARAHLTKPVDEMALLHAINSALNAGSDGEGP